MPSASKTIPDDAFLLCEGCGYILHGLPLDSRCPECGRPIAESLGANRVAPAWETAKAPGWRWRCFGRTTLDVILHTASFYRKLTTRTGRASGSFAIRHRITASALLAIAATLHLDWVRATVPGSHGPLDQLLYSGVFFLGLFLWLIEGLTRLIARLTAWEAAYRGLRLPQAAILRALDYHSATCLPVACGMLITIAGYWLLVQQQILPIASFEPYLIIISLEVLLGAYYLFKTYWISMQNIMYANA